jgi:hypothetical protein
MKNNYNFDYNKEDCFEEIISCIKNNGFVILENFLSTNFVKNLHEKTFNIYDNNGITNKLRDIHTFSDGTISSLHNLFDYLPYFHNVLEFENVKKLSYSFFEETSNLKINSSYFAKPAKIGVETKPHQDNAFFCIEPSDVLTFWFPVEYSGLKNGPLYYYPGSNNLGNLKHEPLGNLGTSMTLSSEELAKLTKEIEPHYAELSVGGCIIHNGLVVHGSDENTSEKSRNAFNFSIFGIKAKKNIELHNLYKKNLEVYLLKNKK